jgi:hypothetical protein
VAATGSTSGSAYSRASDLPQRRLTIAERTLRRPRGVT